jgi:colanic acid/amylovoran biosynthesis glycosyltransferase
LDRPRLTVAYLFTTFPKPTETFLQREVLAMQRLGVDLRLYSLWGGGGEFAGRPVVTFNKWRLLQLFWMIPWWALTQWSVFSILLHGLFTRKPPGWMNFWENMLGAGFAAFFRSDFLRAPPDLVHAAWGGAPATAAWCFRRALRLPYSSGAHAYDIYEHGGDWWLNEKLEDAAFVHTSTAMGKASLVERGVPAEKIHVIHRGLDQMPPLKTLRSPRTRLRIVCVARLVEKKGLDHQMRICAALQQAGRDFELRVVGRGRLLESLQRLARELGIEHRVTFLGHLPFSGVLEQLAWADVLIHTGVIAASGDRDGLPNVIPEAMAAGVLVVTSPTAATTEAVHDEQTGLVADVRDHPAWVKALQRLAEDDALAERLRPAARTWVETHFDAHKNAARLLSLFNQAVQG